MPVPSRSRLGWLLLLLPTIAVAGEISIRSVGGVYTVHGWTPGSTVADWSSTFSVYAGDSDVPMLGSYSTDAGMLAFKPRFPAAPAVPTRAVFRLPGKPAIEARFEPPVTAAKTRTQVRQVYPSSDTLPENQLKFYIEFTAPMGRGDAWQHIRLLDSAGKTVELPFLEIDQELWDREQRRLTVLFDPGRIKRGVLPLEEIGPSIEQGKSYTLVIDRAWQDADGLALSSDFRKPFRVITADREPLDPKKWRVTTPQPGTRDPLIVDTPDPLDYALMLRLVFVSGPNGQVSGTASADRQETQWRFIPAAAWKPGSYELLVDSNLEDRAGNRVGRPFDVDTFDRISVRLSSKTVSLPFRIGGQ